MGLFDSYFDPATYQPDNGSMVTRLLSALQVNPQGTTFAPQHDSTQAVGNYQMPVFGAPAPQAAMPQAAQPVQYQAPQEAPAPAAQPAFLQPQSSGGGLGGAMRGLAANMQGGPLGMIGGAIAGGLGMGRGTEQDQQRQTLTQNYNALIAAGVPPQKAMLAVINPEAAKTIIPDTLGTNRAKYQKIGQNGLGAEQYGFVDEKNQTINGKPVSELPQDSTASAGIGNMDLTGKEYLASLPTAQRVTVQGMIDGTIAPPSSFALSKPYWQTLIAAAKNADPSFDATNWSGRVAGLKDFSAGKSSEMVRSANQTLHHVGQLLDSMDALNNGSYPLKNKIGNYFDEASGGDAPGNFRTNAHAVAEELSKVFKGSNLSDAEIHAWEQNLHENMSPQQQRGQIGKLRDLLQGSLQALEEKRLNSIGPVAAEKQGPLIKEEGQRVLNRIDAWMKNTGKESASPSGPVKSGTYTWTPNGLVAQ